MVKIFKEKFQEEIIIMPQLIEKYNNLAREALSNGDKILSENYFQHADHFTRILDEKEINNKSKISDNLSSKSESEVISNESNKENEPERSQDIKGSN